MGSQWAFCSKTPLRTGGEAAPGRDAGLQEAPQPAGADRHVGALARGCWLV
jgi:hypothetical protein